LISECTDNELLALLRADNQAAFIVLYNRHWKFLYTASYNALKHKQDSMDVCQAVFLWVWENRQVINVQTTLEGYLYTAVKYKIANLIRNGKVRETLLDDLLSADIHAEEALY
jgi:DNA-directed RNA polymerase specialized sigma24 family protein